LLKDGQKMSQVGNMLFFVQKGLDGSKKHGNKSTVIDLYEGESSTGGPSSGDREIQIRGHKATK
jgi:hypothetical protein